MTIIQETGKWSARMLAKTMFDHARLCRCDKELFSIFHKKGETDLELQKKSDEEKNKLCEEANIPLVRIDSREWDGGDDSFWKLVLPELPDILCTRIRELIFD